MAFDFAAITDVLPYLAKGLAYSVQLTVVAAAGGIAVGTVLAVARMSRVEVIRLGAAVYVDVARSIPLILVLFWFYFLTPLVLQLLAGAARPVGVSAETCVVVTFVLFEAAYFCEIVRAGIRSVAPGQMDAARALGLTERQCFAHVILPQAFRNMLPVFLTQTIILFQDTSLVYVLSITDFLGAASKIAQRDSRLVELYSFCALVYLVLCVAFSRGVSVLQRRRSQWRSA